MQRIYDFDYESVLGEGVRTVVDLGANIGLSTLYLQARFPSAQMLCVEPVDANVEMLRRNAQVNGFAWRIEAAAVTSETKTVSLYPNEWWSSSSVTPHVADPAGRWGQPSDAAKLATFLLSQQAEWITGQTIASEGGFRR